MERRTYTVEEAAVLLGIGRNSAYEAARTGKIPVIKIGKRMVIPCLALDRLLKGEAIEEAGADGEAVGSIDTGAGPEKPQRATQRDSTLRVGFRQ